MRPCNGLSPESEPDASVYEAEITADPQSFLKRLRNGDIGPLVDRMTRHIERVERHGEAQGTRADAVGRDVAVIAGIALTMLGFKALKVLPSIPFAPGYKMVILLPLYVAASRLTRTRLGATITGLVMGTVAFLLGDGRYGIFEVAKHVAPGLICDLLLPLFLAGGRRPGRLAWSLFGSVVAVGRFATIFGVTLAVQAPAVAWAFVAPRLLGDLFFGLMSGYGSYHLSRAIEVLRERGLSAPDENVALAPRGRLGPNEHDTQEAT